MSTEGSRGSMMDESRRGMMNEPRTSMRGDLEAEGRRPVSGFAVGVTMFAAAMMAVIGGFHIITGIAALVEDDFFVLTRSYVYEFDVTTWGWIHLIAGIVVFIASFGLLTGNALARTVGVLAAIASMIANFMWLPWYPIWSVVIIALDIIVIWALTFHGRDIVNARESW